MLYRCFITLTSISIINISILAQEVAPSVPHLQQHTQHQNASARPQDNILQSNFSLKALCLYSFTAFSCFSAAVFDGFKAVDCYNPYRKSWYKCKEICRIPFTASMYAAAADQLETTFVTPPKKKSTHIASKIGLITYMVGYGIGSLAALLVEDSYSDDSDDTDSVNPDLLLSDQVSSEQQL